MYDWEEMLLYGMRFELGWIVMIVFALIVLLGGIALVRWLAASSGPRARDRSDARTAEELLRERYARGEMDAAEFQRRLDDLRFSRRSD